VSAPEAELVGERAVESLGGVVGGGLPVEVESDGLFGRGTLGEVHSIDGRRRGVSDDQIGAAIEADIPSDAMAGSCAHTGFVYGVCDAQSDAEVDGRLRAGPGRQDGASGGCEAEMQRRDPADGERPRDTSAMCDVAGRVHEGVAWQAEARYSPAVGLAEVARTTGKMTEM
jgi:hypothetical protein